MSHVAIFSLLRTILVVESGRVSRLGGTAAHQVIFPPRFLYDGDRVNENDTPASLDMDDNGTYRSGSQTPQRIVLPNNYPISQMLSMSW